MRRIVNARNLLFLGCGAIVVVVYLTITGVLRPPTPEVTRMQIDIDPYRVSIAVPADYVMQPGTYRSARLMLPPQAQREDPARAVVTLHLWSGLPPSPCTGDDEPVSELSYADPTRLSGEAGLTTVAMYRCAQKRGSEPTSVTVFLRAPSGAVLYCHAFFTKRLTSPPSRAALDVATGMCASVHLERLAASG